MDGFVTMIYRQIKRFINSRSRFVMSIVNPIIWIIFFGLGWSNVFRFPEAKVIFGGLDYLTYLASGMVAMSIIMSSFMSGMSVIWDKRFGFLKETLVAPASRAEVILGRAFGDSIISVFQGLIILIFMYFITSKINLLGVLPALTYGLILAMCFTSFGLVIALKLSSMEGFQMIINLMTMPLLFLGGIFYPIDSLPEWIKVIAYINPVTYAVDGMRYSLTRVSKFEPIVDVFILSSLAAIMSVLAVRSYNSTTIED
ncbi:MAG: ABC transporter permease [Sulfolobales archaeon]|nr:ABC transporter permease [Sulfolobales archaeon]MDW7969399.1 ABC transporter permease [Sulfolobales archaeon]